MPTFQFYASDETIEPAKQEAARRNAENPTGLTHDWRELLESCAALGAIENLLWWAQQAAKEEALTRF
jgi:hypothetical protein